MFEWKSSYSVGVAVVDAQHQNLFAIAAELHTAMAAGKGKDVLARTLDRLVRYTEAHFLAEEQLMRNAKYPGLAEHQVLHRALTAQVKQFEKEFQEGKITMSVEIFHFLSTWLQQHIREKDRQYVPFVQKKAVA